MRRNFNTDDARAVEKLSPWCPWCFAPVAEITIDGRIHTFNLNDDGTADLLWSHRCARIHDEDALVEGCGGE